MGGVLAGIHTAAPQLPDLLAQLWRIAGLANKDEQLPKLGHVAVDFGNELEGIQLKFEWLWSGMPCLLGIPRGQQQLRQVNGQPMGDYGRVPNGQGRAAGHTGRWLLLQPGQRADASSAGHVWMQTAAAELKPRMGSIKSQDIGYVYVCTHVCVLAGWVDCLMQAHCCCPVSLPCVNKSRQLNSNK